MTVPTGIDTIAVTFPVDGYKERTASLRGFAVGSPEERWSASRRWDLPGGGWVSVNRAMAGRLELSVPNRAFGHNLSPMSLAGTMPVLADAFDEMLEVIDVDPANLLPDRLGLSRLDLVHDFFGVEDIGTILGILRLVPQRKGVDVDAWSTGDDPSLGSLAVRTRTAFRTILYDKGRESGGGVSPGHLRFETQLKRPRLEPCSFSETCGGPVFVLADLTDAIIESMARAMFDEVGFGRTMIPHDDLADRIEKIDNLSDRDKTGLGAHLLWLEAGRRPPTSPRTFQKYEALAGRYGLIAAGDALSVPVRLDWDAATEVRGDQYRFGFQR